MAHEKSKKKESPKKVVEHNHDKPRSNNLAGNVSVEHYFILCNGQPLKNVLELADAVEDLRDEIFLYHVTPDKNDFATWINDIYADSDLANELANVKDKTRMKIVLYRNIIKRLLHE